MRRRTNCRFFAAANTACFARLVYFRIARRNRPQSQNDDHISESLVPPVPGPCRPSAHSATTRPIYEVRSQTRPDTARFVGIHQAPCGSTRSEESPTVQGLCHPSRLRDVGDSVLYHSPSGSASPQQVSGSVAGDGDHSLKWITAPKCAQWHS
jgi:hypothetical protein